MIKIPLYFKIYRNILSLASYIFPNFIAKIAANRFYTPIRKKCSSWEEEILKTGKVEILNNGIKSWWWGSGPLILLVHGWNGRGSQLGYFVKPLVDAGFQVVMIDGPAHGDSAGKKSNLADFARKMVAIKDQLGPLYGIITHSLGGAATVLAYKMGGFTSKKLIMISSFCNIQDSLDQYTHFMKLSKKSKQAFQTITEHFANYKISEAQVDLITPSMKIPALVIHDKSDKEVPYSNALKLTQNWPSATLLLTDGLGHQRILKSEDIIKKTVDFLQK